MPAEIRDAHKHSSNHRQELERSSEAGCFYCCSIFDPALITEWIDGRGPRQTALCPRCGIDSVIGDRSGFPVSKEFLSLMRAHWFES